MEHPLFSFIITVFIFLGLALLAQWMGGRGILFGSPTTNAFGLEVKKGGSKEEGQEGGDAIDILHAIPGHRIVRRGRNIMDWTVEPDDEVRDWLFRTFGIIWLGLYHTLRVNKIRSFRFGRKDEESEYHIMAKSADKRWVPYSGQQDIEINDIETKDVLGVNLKLNIPYVMKYPARAMLKVADSHAVLTMMAREEVIDICGENKLSEIVSGDRRIKTAIESAVLSISRRIEKESGISISRPNLFDVAMNEATKRLMELNATKKKELEAEITAARLRVQVEEANAHAEVKKAEGRRNARLLDIDAEEQYIQRNVNPRAKNEFTVRVTEAEALRDSKVTHNVKVNIGK